MGGRGGEGGGGGNKDVITIQTSTMTPAIGYSISYVCLCWWVGVGQWLQMHFTLTTRVGTCVRLITMEMSIHVK